MRCRELARRPADTVKKRYPAYTTGSIASNVLFSVESAKPSSVVYAGTAASSWKSTPKFAKHASQSTGANQPAYKTLTQNDLNVLSFDGSNDTMTYANLSLSGKSSVTLFFVCYIDSTTSGFDNPLAFGTGSEGRLETSSAGGDVLKIISALGITATDVNAWGVGIDNNYCVFSLTTNSVAVSTRLNGTVQYLAGQAGNWATGSGNYAIMASATPNRHLKGKMAEIKIVGHACSAAEIRHENTYLRKKWGTA